MKLMTVKELQEKIAVTQGAKASAAQRAHDAAEKEKQELLDRLSHPSGLSDEQIIEKATIIINRAVENGMMAVQVLRFPNSICTDHGRAINQVEPGWEKTLTGIPKELYEFWQRHLQPHGYHLRYEIIDFPGGMPGDVGVTLSWG
ncbi:hypothetical protein BH11PSE3_BH11PSE3_26230 [soil metagenome]